MRRAHTAVLAVLALVSAAMPGAYAREKTPAGSFLQYRATTVSELTSQVSSDSAVRSRYAKHFSISSDLVSDYFAKNIKLVTLKAPVKAQTWYVGKDAKVYQKTKLLPKGTLVFATKEGEPVLMWSCGNPLRASLPVYYAEKPKTQNKAGAAAGAVVAAKDTGNTPATTPSDDVQVMAQDSVADQLVETKVLANPVETVAAATIAAPPAPAAIAAVPAVAAPPAAAAVAVPSVAVAPAVAAGAKFGLGWLGALGGLAGALALNGGGSSSPAVAPVPEPTALVALGMGLMAAPFALRRRRK